MGKNGINARRRRGAVAIATVMAISGLAGCSKAPNRPDSQVVSGFIEESTDEALYGGRLDVVLNQPGYVPANFTFSKETFGVRDDVYSDYTT